MIEEQKDNKAYEKYVRKSVEEVKSKFYDVIAADGSIKSDYTAGLRHGLHSTLEILRNDAIKFGLPLKKINLGDEIPV